MQVSPSTPGKVSFSLSLLLHFLDQGHLHTRDTWVGFVCLLGLGLALEKLPPPDFVGGRWCLLVVPSGGDGYLVLTWLGEVRFCLGFLVLGGLQAGLL